VLGRASTDVDAAQEAGANGAEVSYHLDLLERIVVNYMRDNGGLDKLADTLKVGKPKRPFILNTNTLYLALIDDSPARARIVSDAWEVEANRLEAEAA